MRRPPIFWYAFLSVASLFWCARIYADSVGVETNPRPLPVVLAAATLPNYGLKSIDERVKKLFPGAVQVRMRKWKHNFRNQK